MNRVVFDNVSSARRWQRPRSLDTSRLRQLRRGSASSGLRGRTFWSRPFSCSGKVGRTTCTPIRAWTGSGWSYAAGSGFYGEDDAVLGEFGKHEGVMIPRNVKYWFESVGAEPLELLQVEARVAGQTADRIDHSERKLGQVVNTEAGPATPN